MPRYKMKPHLIQRENGYWYVRYHDEHGRTKFKSTGTQLKGQAKAFLATFSVTSKTRRRRPQEMTVHEVIDLYLNTHIRRSKRDQSRVEYAVQNLRHLGEHTVEDLDSTHIDAYIAGRMDGSIGRKSVSGTVRVEVSILVSAFNNAVRERVLSMQDIPYIPLPEASPPRERWLTKDEADRFMQAAHDLKLRELMLFILLGIYTAARKSTIEALCWGHIDFDNRLIRYDLTRESQTKKRRVPVPMNKALFGHLLQRRPADWDKRKLLYADTPIFSLSNFRHQFKQATDKAGLDGVTPHTLRHTAATWMSQAGRTMEEIADVLGDSIAVVEKHYKHHHPDFVRGAVESIEFEQ